MEVAAAMTGILEFPESMESMKYDCRIFLAVICNLKKSLTFK